MKRLLAALLLVAAPALAQSNGWREAANGWGEIQTATGGGGTPATCTTAGMVPVFLGSPLALGCDAGLTYDAATDTLTGTGTSSFLVSKGAYIYDPNGDFGFYTGEGVHLGSAVPLRWASTTGYAGTKDTGLARFGPSILSITDGSTGYGSLYANGVYIKTPTTNAAALQYNGLSLLSNGIVNWSNSTTQAWAGTADTGLHRVSDGLVGVTSGGSNLGSLQAGNVTAVALGTPTVTAPLTVNGTPGATTYGYKAVAFLNDGTSSAASAETTIATGPAVLNSTDSITVAVPAVTGMAYMNIYRTTGGAAPPKLIYSGTSPSYIDTGTETGAETPATKNTTGYAAAARAKIIGLVSYANNAAALAAGLVAGDLYTITGSDPLAVAVAY